jgi:2-polyprenyl-6-methoxyphenol hydroxylase-like FAD-dependent oxidoreductase
MARIVVLGAGLNGLASALLLARDEHSVTVLERDADVPTGDAEDLWANWNRPSVSQFRVGHYMLARWRVLVEQELPEVLEELERLGGLRIGPLDVLPHSVTGGRRAADQDLRGFAARRPVLEGALAAVASRTPGLVIRRGQKVEELVRTSDAVVGVPHVRGMLTREGEFVSADLVVDAMGRNSPLTGMLAGIGAEPPVEQRDDLGSVYYGRHFHIDDPDVSLPPPGPLSVDSMAVLVFPADGRTFSVNFAAANNDREFRELRSEGAWERVLDLFPALAALRSVSTPITGVQVIGGGADRHRSFERAGRPVATGVVAVGDAAVRTNPMFGRGSSIGLMQACVLRDVLREVPTERPEQVVRRFTEVSQAAVMPLYQLSLEMDRARMEEIQADVLGVPHPPPGARRSVARGLAGLARTGNAEALRASIRSDLHLLDPVAALEEPGLRAALAASGPMPPPYPPGSPTRSEVIAAIGAAQREIDVSGSRRAWN